MQALRDKQPNPRKREQHSSTNGKWRWFPQVPHLLQYVISGNYFGKVKNQPPDGSERFAIGLPQVFRFFVAVAFCAGILTIALSLCRRVGLIPLAAPTPDSRIWLLKVGLGLCWAGVLLVLLALR